MKPDMRDAHCFHWLVRHARSGQMVMFNPVVMLTSEYSMWSGFEVPVFLKQRPNFSQAAIVIIHGLPNVTTSVHLYSYFPASVLFSVRFIRLATLCLRLMCPGKMQSVSLLDCVQLLCSVCLLCFLHSLHRF